MPDTCRKFEGSNSSNSSSCEVHAGASGGKLRVDCQRGLWVGIAHSVATCSRCLTPPDIPHSNRAVLQCVDSPSKSSCPVFCDDGYETHTPRVRCQDGTWEQAVCQPLSCSAPPTVENSIVSSLASCQGIASGSSCSLKCNKGYFKTGDLLCQLGQFNNPRCHVAGYLGLLHVDLVQDVMSNVPGAQAPGWFATSIRPPSGDEFSSSVALRTSANFAFDDDLAHKAGVRFDLPAVYVGPKGGTITFSWRVESESGKDLLHFSVDDHEKDSNGFPQSGPRSTSWQTAKFPLSEGLHTCAWTYTKDKSVSLGQDAAWIADIMLDNAALLAVYHVQFRELQATQTGSAASWTEVPAKTPSGEWGHILQSGELGAEEPEDKARIDMTLPDIEIAAPSGMISFFYRTSSELSFDFLRFLVDGVEQHASNFPQSGQQRKWHLAKFQIASGKHSLTWRYEKDAKGRAGDDVAYVADIQVRNMKVTPIKLVEHARFTHASGDLASQEVALTSLFANYFGVPRSMTAVKFAEIAETDLNNKHAAVSAAIPGDVHDASLYKFYDVQISVSCSASTACANISATMARTCETPAVVGKLLSGMLKQPMIKVLTVFIDDAVVGEVAPGLVSSITPLAQPTSRLYRKRSERREPSIGFARSVFAHVQEGSSTIVTGLVALALVGCYFGQRSLRACRGRYDSARLGDYDGQSISLSSQIEADSDIE